MLVMIQQGAPLGERANVPAWVSLSVSIKSPMGTGAVVQQIKLLLEMLISPNRVLV